MPDLSVETGLYAIQKGMREWQHRSRVARTERNILIISRNRGTTETLLLHPALIVFSLAPGAIAG